MHSDCGPENRTLTGNFLLTFENCTITINNNEYKAYEIRTVTKEIQGALHNLHNIRLLIEEQNRPSINQETFQNRNKLQHVYLKQFNHEIFMWTLSGGVLIALTSISIIILLICNQRSKTTVKVENKLPSKNPSKRYEELLKLAGLQSKDEDAFFSPPGGVIL